MGSFVIRPAAGLKGKVIPEGDKSIAHRAVILSALAAGKTVIGNSPLNEDCRATQAVFKRLGIKIAGKLKGSSSVIKVNGKGLFGLNKPTGPIFINESGTTLRLILGVLAGQDFSSRLCAGRSLSRRPMLRVILPLRLMGAKICAKRIAHGAKSEEYPPITIRGGKLKAIVYKMPVASAQVKSAILLAGLYAKGSTKIIEPLPTRDHTERMLRHFGADIKITGITIVIKGGRELKSPKKIYVPGDISSAAFFLVAGAIVPNSRVIIKNVSLNPSRLGVVRVLKRMGAHIQVTGHRSQVTGGEPMGDIVVSSSRLEATTVRQAEVPSMIDELPVLMVAASLARGKTVFQGVEELRVKETDRIASMKENLGKMGAKIRVLKNNGREDIHIIGVKELNAANLRSFGDHRTAMSTIIAGLTAKGSTRIDDVSCINKSFPDFIAFLKTLVV